ncbi:MAG: flagellar export chaperone FliS [Candidatus Cloacimonadota bacterium]|nr:flagellar export chaperone FliS [Candidatus Cloacimonadota bacterium]
MQNHLNTYKQINVNTTNRGKIVVMLFSGAITFLNKAKVYANQKDYYNKGKFITKAQKIIDELNISLDMKKGKDISQNLRSLYIFLGKYLNKANIKNNPQMIDECIKILNVLKESFDEIVTNPKYKEAQSIKKRELLQNSIRRYV